MAEGCGDPLRVKVASGLGSGFKVDGLGLKVA